MIYFFMKTPSLMQWSWNFFNTFLLTAWECSQNQKITWGVWYLRTEFTYIIFQAFGAQEHQSRIFFFWLKTICGTNVNNKRRETTKVFSYFNAFEFLYVRITLSIYVCHLLWKHVSLRKSYRADLIPTSTNLLPTNKIRTDTKCKYLKL